MIHRVAVADVELAVEDIGAGPVTLLVHGFPLDRTMWRELAPRLSGRRLLIPDLRGFGESSGPGIETATMERYADDLAGLLDALQVSGPITFCGLSMGGYIGWQFWRRHPARVRQLVMCDTRSAADTVETREQRLRTAADVLERGVAELAEGMSKKLFSPATASTRPEFVEATRHVMLGTRRETVAAALRGMAQRVDATPWLAEIDVPTLLVCGVDDVITPLAEMRQVAAALPRSRLVEIANAGHMAPLERAAEVAGAIDG